MNSCFGSEIDQVSVFCVLAVNQGISGGHSPEPLSFILSLGVNLSSSGFILRLCLIGALECPQFKYTIKEEQ